MSLKPRSGVLNNWGNKKVARSRGNLAVDQRARHTRRATQQHAKEEMILHSFYSYTRAAFTLYQLFLPAIIINENFVLIKFFIPYSPSLAVISYVRMCIILCHTWGNRVLCLRRSCKGDSPRAAEASFVAGSVLFGTMHAWHTCALALLSGKY